MKNLIYILLLVVLLIMAGYYYFSEQGSTLEREFSDFAVEDTSLVNKIFIADFDGITATLERQENNTWLVNDEYKARQDAIDLLLTTFNSIAVKEPVAMAARENIITRMAGKSIKVEIYAGEEIPAKTYYVGNPTKNHFGTYMLLEKNGVKSSTPYVTHIPGFSGFLTARFFTDVNLWRDRTIFAIDANEVKSVQISYTEKPLKSFRLSRNEGSVEVIDLNSRLKIEPLNQLAIEEYLSRFKSIHFEKIVEETPLDNIDSVLATEPLHVIEVESTSGRKTQVKTYYRPARKSTIFNPATGAYYTYDADRLYGWINEKDFVMIQWPTLDKILAYNSDFIAPEIVDNY